MEPNYYYSTGRRIPVHVLRSAQVVEIPEDRTSIAVPGWRSVPLGNKRFQMLVQADLIDERTLQVPRLEDLTQSLIEADEAIRGQEETEEERSLREEVGANTISVLAGRHGGLLLPTGEVVAKFLPDLDRASITQELELRNAVSVRLVTFSANTFIFRPDQGGTGLALANDLVESRLVEFASPNFIEEMPLRSVEIPSNGYFDRQWHLHNTGESGSVEHADVDALAAWQITKGSPDVVICIMDSGIDSSHEAFSPAGKLVPGFDFEDDDPFSSPTSSSHGTSCAGVAAAPWGIGKTVGIAPECRLMPIRRASLSEHLKMAEAFAWAADNLADVISCSFGYDHRPWILPDIVRAAIDHAVDHGRKGKGCIILWAAGNGNESISTDEWACYEKTISVAASSDQDRRSPYSDFGPEVDLCAPSSGGRSSIWTTSVGGYTAHFGGTSSAAPLVAGVAALLVSVNPNLTWQDVREALRNSAEKIDPDKGAYDDAGHSDLYGFGRVNARKALEALSVLNEAVRDTDLAPHVPKLHGLASEHIAAHSSGKQVLRFLEDKKIDILRLLVAEDDFREHVVTVLRVAVNLYDSFQRGENFTVKERDWGSIEAALDRLLVVKSKDDRHDETKEERTVMTETNSAGMENVWDRLAEILQSKGNVGPGQQEAPTPSTTESPGPSAPTASPASPADGWDPSYTMKLRELVAAELQYQSMIPPLTPELCRWMDEFLEQIPDLLKGLKHRPFMAAQVSSIVAQTQQQSRSEDPELVALAERIAKDTGEDSGERIIPLAAAMVAAIVGGITTGRAVHQAIH